MYQPLTIFWAGNLLPQLSLPAPCFARLLARTRLYHGTNNRPQTSYSHVHTCETMSGVCVYVSRTSFVKGCWRSWYSDTAFGLVRGKSLTCVQGWSFWKSILIARNFDLGIALKDGTAEQPSFGRFGLRQSLGMLEFFVGTFIWTYLE